jgi:hypothetical protein
MFITNCIIDRNLPKFDLWEKGGDYTSVNKLATKYLNEYTILPKSL